MMPVIDVSFRLNSKVLSILNAQKQEDMPSPGVMIHGGVDCGIIAQNVI
jgi:hypothetical protein